MSRAWFFLCASVLLALVSVAPARATCPPQFLSTTIASDAECIFRNFNTDGVSSSGIYNPAKSDIVSWGAAIGGALTIEPLALSLTADNSTAINNAIAAASAAGGAVLQLPCGGPYPVAQILLQSFVYIQGCGQDATILLQPSASNEAMVTQTGIASLFGSNTYGGIAFAGLSSLTLNGNYLTGNTSGDCLQMYGRRLRLNNIKITNCAGNGIRSEWGPAAPSFVNAQTDNSMEGDFDNVRIWNTGQIGWSFNGPHDSRFSGVIISGASQSADNGFQGLLIGQHGNGRFFDFHYYAADTTYAACGVDIESRGSNFVASQFEGAHTPLYIGNGITCTGVTLAGGGFYGQNTFDDSNAYYNATTGPEIIVRSPFNVIHGFMSGAGSLSGSATNGIELGQAAFPTDNVSSEDIHLLDASNDNGTINFAHEPTGFASVNRIALSGGQDSGPAFVGTPQPSDIVSILLGGATPTIFEQNNQGKVVGAPSGVVLNSATAPTIASGFGTGAAVQNPNGTASFQVAVGTGGTATTGTLTMPAAGHAWACSATDVTTLSSTVFMTRAVGSSTSVVLTNLNSSAAAAAWASGDLLEVQCAAN